MCKCERCEKGDQEDEVTDVQPLAGASVSVETFPSAVESKSGQKIGGEMLLFQSKNPCGKARDRSGGRMHTMLSHWTPSVQQRRTSVLSLLIVASGSNVLPSE